MLFLLRGLSRVGKVNYKCATWWPKSFNNFFLLSIGRTPTGENLSTYRELCSLASDLNQPDLVYKFMHLANYNAMWNSRKGAAFGFGTIATKAGEQLEPHLPKIIPKLYR